MAVLLKGNIHIFSIGEFSKITGLSVKALHLYHEKGLLIPAQIDRQTGYRYFNSINVEQARTIIKLRQLSFSLEEIRSLIEGLEDDTRLLDVLTTKRDQIMAQLAHLKGTAKTLESMIAEEKEFKAMAEINTFKVEEKTLPAVVIVSKRWKGRYQATGDAFAELGKKMGRFISGKPMNLYHDAEFREDDADIQSCFPLRRQPATVPSGLEVKEVPGGKFVSLVHQGPYTDLGKSYERLFAYLHEKGLQAQLPSREVYLKGPGMLFRGNPRKYLTEIQVPVI